MYVENRKKNKNRLNSELHNNVKFKSANMEIEEQSG